MTEPITETSEQEPQEGTEQTEPKAFDAEYVDKLRKEAAKYRTEAKANSDAARKLAAIEEANKTEAQKSADRLAAAEKDVADARNESLRYRIAAEFKLTEKQAAALAHVSSEDGMREVAGQLAASESDRKKHGNFAPREGTNPQSGGSDDLEVVRNLFAG